MTAPTVRLSDVLIAGYAHLYGIDVQVTCAAPLQCDCCWDLWMDGTHMWITPTPAQRAAWAKEVPSDRPGV